MCHFIKKDPIKVCRNQLRKNSILGLGFGSVEEHMLNMHEALGLMKEKKRKRKRKRWSGSSTNRP
jgi:hypothetical protein